VPRVPEQSDLGSQEATGTFVNESTVVSTSPEELPIDLSFPSEEGDERGDFVAGARISVVIPTINEEGNLARTLGIVLARPVWEVIVVDGGSVDGTVDIAREMGVEVVESARGRGLQLNTGAARASGDVFLFLHADTLLPECFDEDVISTLQSSSVSLGAFQLCIDAPGRAYRVIEKCVACRSRMFQRPYGDQALFLKSDVFEELGGFPDYPVLEDYELVRWARKLGRVKLAEGCVVTSGRRWEARGVWKTTILNQVIIAAYRMGVSVERIARWRDGGRTGGKRGELLE